jgi:hypothetical protein
VLYLNTGKSLYGGLQKHEIKRLLKARPLPKLVLNSDS